MERGNLINRIHHKWVKKGFVTGEACLIPKTCLKIYEEDVNGNYEHANEILDEAFPLPNFLLSVRTWCILYC